MNTNVIELSNSELAVISGGVDHQVVAQGLGIMWAGAEIGLGTALVGASVGGAVCTIGLAVVIVGLAS